MSSIAHPRLDEALLASLVVESFLNGTFWVLFFQAAQVLYARSKKRGERFFLGPITITGALLFVTIAGRWILNISLAFDAFILDPSVEYLVKPYGLNPATSVYIQLGNPKTTAINSLYVISIWTADSFMAYRLFIIWGRNWLIVIPPALMAIAFLGTGIMSTYLYSISVLRFIPWVTAALTLTFVCNLYSTSLIAIKIYLAGRKERQRLHHHGYSFSRVLEMLVESALLYSFCVLAALVTYSAQSNLEYVAVYLISPVIGIIYSMIVTRGNQPATGHSTSKSSIVDLQPDGNFKGASQRDHSLSDRMYGEEPSASKGSSSAKEPWSLA